MHMIAHDICIHISTYNIYVKVIVIKLISFSTSKAYSAFFCTLQLQSYVCLTCFIILE